jgi:hypothetical protein
MIDRAEHTRRLGHLKLHDNLTGLPNAFLAQDRLDRDARLADSGRPWWCCSSTWTGSSWSTTGSGETGDEPSSR